MVTVEAVLALLNQEGALTDIEIRRWFGCKDRRGVSKVLHKLRVVYKPKRVYICKWVHHDPDGRGRSYPRARYKLGSKPCAPKPPPKTGADRTKAYEERLRRKQSLPTVAFANSSVFAMASSIDRDGSCLHTE